MNVAACLEQFERVRKCGAGWIAQCPGPNHKHGDRKSSLSIAEGDDGRVLLNCKAGCDISQICAAKGWKVSDLFPERPNGNHHQQHSPQGHNPPNPATANAFRGTDNDVERMLCELVKAPEKSAIGPGVRAYIESRGISLRVATDLKWGAARWTFRDEQGQFAEKPALAVPHYATGKLVGIKFRTIDGSKLFSQMPGSSLDGFYAIARLDSNVIDVLILEGPEDAALAISHGFPAVAINAAAAKVSQSDIALISRHKRISLLGDQDQAGQRAMDVLQERLPVEQRIRVRLPGFKDIGDLYADDPTKFADQLRKILRMARASREYFEPDDLLTENEVEAGLDGIEPYVIDKLVPRNSITMKFGEEKGGKTALAFYFGKCVVNGRAVFGKYAVTKCPVLYMDLENSDFDIKNFATLFARVGPELVRYRTRATGCPDLNSPGLVRFCERFKPLVIFDSLTKFLKGADPFHPGEMSDLFDKLLNLCAAGATVILIHHATRDDALRYANSHQIGASVARAFAVVSEDRPQLRRVRLECILSRGAEPITEHLVGFPVIADRGEFGLSADSDPFASELETLLAFVKSQPGEACFKETIKKRPGKRAAGNLELLDLAIKRGILVVREDRKVAFPNSGTADADGLSFPSSGTDGNGDHEI